MSIGEKEKNGIGGASNSAPQDTSSDIFDRNLQAFTEYARGKGAEVNDDGSIAFKGVILTGIRQALSELGADRDPVDTEEVWRRVLLGLILSVLIECVKQKGAVLGDDGKLVFKYIPITSD